MTISRQSIKQVIRWNYQSEKSLVVNPEWIDAMTDAVMKVIGEDLQLTASMQHQHQQFVSAEQQRLHDLNAQNIEGPSEQNFYAKVVPPTRVEPVGWRARDSANHAWVFYLTPPLSRPGRIIEPLYAREAS